MAANKALVRLAVFPLAAAFFFQEAACAAVATIEATTETVGEEESGAGVFTVTLSEAAAADVTISYAVGGSATPGKDYTALPGTLTIPAGETSGTILVTPIDDYTSESDETDTVTLQAGEGYTVGDPSSAVVTIIEDDPSHGAGQIRPRSYGGRIILVSGNPARDRLKMRLKLNGMTLPFGSGKDDDKDIFEGSLRIGQKETAREFPFLMDGRGRCRSKDYLRIRINPRTNRVKVSIAYTNLRKALGVSLDEDMKGNMLEVPVMLTVGGHSGRGTLLFVLWVRANTDAMAKY